MFEIHLHSHDMRWLEDQTLREGKKVEISAGEPPGRLLKGKIAALEPELDEVSPQVVVRFRSVARSCTGGTAALLHRSLIRTWPSGWPTSPVCARAPSTARVR